MQLRGSVPNQRRPAAGFLLTLVKLTLTIGLPAIASPVISG